MTRIVITAGVMWALTLFVPATGWAQETRIYACADGHGRLRIVTQSTECNNRETLVTWNIAGLPGSAGVRILDSSPVPQQVGHWLGVMDGLARVGFHAVLPGGQALDMSLPIARGGFVTGGELFFPVDPALVVSALQACLSDPDSVACLLARFEQHVRAGEICQGAPYMPATATDPLSPTAFFDTTAILGSQAELYRADTSVTPTTIGTRLGTATLVVAYVPDPVDPVLRCRAEMRPTMPFAAYPTAHVLSLYSVFTPPFRISIDGSGDQ